MDVITIFVDVLVGVLQIFIYIAIGFLLAKLSPMDLIGEKKFNLATYYVFLPLHCAIEISAAIDLGEQAAEVGLLAFSFTVSTVLAALLSFLYCKITGVDVRVVKSFLIVSCLGSVTAFPAVMAGSLCDDGGAMHGDPNCEYYQGYSLIGLLMLNIYLWIASPLLISRDKVKCYNLRRKMYLIRNFYDTVEEFMNDKAFSKLDQVQQEKHGEVIGTIESDRETTTNDFFDHVPDEHPHETLDEEALIEYSLQVNMSESNHDAFVRHFKLLLQRIHPNVFENIKQTLPRTIKPVPVDIKYILLQLASPPIMACILGLVVGAIGPISDGLYGTQGKRYVITSLRKLSGVAIPFLVALLGAKLSHGFTFTKTVNLRVKDLVALGVIRLLLIPAIGLAFVALLKEMASGQKDNEVLFFIIYAFWNVPPSVLVISAFLMVGYYSKELAIIQFWTNSLSAIFMTVFFV